MDTEKPLGVLRARFLLLVGGTFGWHRLYLRQVPEAFIYFSTFGVFLLGLFYDSFYINSEVREYNERIEGRQNEEKAKLAKQPNVSEHAPFSLTRNLYAILYGCYLGLFTWLAGNISFGGTLADNFPLLIAVAGAISTGVFLIGNSGRMTMKAAQIWISTFTLLAITARLAESSPARSIFFSAITGTLVGNRGIKRLSPRDRPYSYKHYVFWCSLWLFCLCLLGTGACRQLLEKRVSFHSNEARVSSTLATLLYDRYKTPLKVYKLFELPDVKVDFEKNRRKPGKSSDQPWSWLMDVSSPPWTDEAVAFTLDLLKGEARARKGKLVHEPLKWAAWRLYLRWTMKLDSRASDADYQIACGAWRKKNTGKVEGKKMYDVTQIVSVRRACEVVTS